MAPAENIVGSQVCPGHRGQNGLAGIPEIGVCLGQNAPRQPARFP